MSPPTTSRCWFLTGPTAAGKTAVGVELARRLGAEIISMDSMALYRGMDIGTAKPTAAERGSAPHHLIDLLAPHEEFSLAQYIDAAERARDEIRSRGREVLFVGGTPLYLKGLLRGIFEGPSADWDFRQTLQRAAEDDPASLHRRLAEVDPGAALRLHPNDARRLIRALEVFHVTGRPISELQRQFEVGRRSDECRVFVLQWPRAELYARIGRRVDAMFAAGLVDEVRRLIGGSGPPSRTARQALGYREVIAHLELGVPLQDTIELVKTHTRQMAKRQLTWFRSLSECRFVPMASAAGPAQAAAEIHRQGAGTCAPIP